MKYISKIFLALMILSAASCSEKRHNYIVLIDNSKSITESLWEKYISQIQNTILNNMRSKDKLTIQFIDECSMIKSERIFSVNLAEINFTYPGDGKLHEEDSVKARLNRFLNDSINPAIQQILTAKRDERKNCGKYTDILNAINESKSLFTSEKSFSSTFDKVSNDAQDKDNYEYTTCLIIFSDMINEDAGRQYDFTNMGTMNKTQISKIAKDLQSAQAIPNLNGVEVFVYGATSGKNIGVYSNQQVENIKTFWLQYFEYAGAKLKAYGYDTETEIQQYVSNNTE